MGSFAVVAFFFIFVAIGFFQFFKPLDASKEDPQKLYLFYVQKQMPPSLKVQSAFGRATRMGGTSITFRFQIGQEDLDELISSKHLRKTDGLQTGLFSDADLST